eukprot:gene722-784_t
MENNENVDNESVEERIEIARKDTSASTAEDSVVTHHVIPKVSNFNVLLITAVMFGLFVIAEVIGALAGNSLSLLGDAAAMSVDVFTYITNMYAERVKGKDGKLSVFATRVLEIFIPIFSVIALLGVTGWIASDAIGIIMEGEDGDGDDVDVIYLFAFASGNFLIDLISAILFYARRKTILLDEQSVTSEEWESTFTPLPSLPNLNMISALTHVSSDTLRTISVFVAALVSTVGGYSSSLCDAWAAIVVTATIVMAVMPLCFEIYKASVISFGPSSQDKDVDIDDIEPVPFEDIREDQ